MNTEYLRLDFYNVKDYSELAVLASERLQIINSLMYGLLTDEKLAELDKIGKADINFVKDFMSSEKVKRFISGTNHRIRPEEIVDAINEALRRKEEDDEFEALLNDLE